MTNLILDARCPVCGEPLLCAFRTVGPDRKIFEYHHDRVPSVANDFGFKADGPCVVVIPQPDVDHYEDMVYKPLIQRSPEAIVQ